MPLHLHFCNGPFQCSPKPKSPGNRVEYLICGQAVSFFKWMRHSIGSATEFGMCWGAERSKARLTGQAEMDKVIAAVFLSIAMHPIRTFIAVELASSVIARANEAMRLLKKSQAEVSWAHVEHMHLTLKFLGNVPETETPDVCRIVAAAAKEVDPFEIVFRGLGAFPTVDHPRTIWLGIDQGQAELAELHAAIEEALKQEMGFSKEHRKFHPHLTLGRLRRESDPGRDELSQLIQENGNFDGDISVVEEVVVFASFLGRHGPKHEALGHASLRA